MKIERQSSIVIFKFLFLIFFFFIAFLQINEKISLDTISLALIIIGCLPVLVPILNKNFKSIELFGIKAELLEKITKQENKIENQEKIIENQDKIIRELVIYSMAFYLYEMLRDFDKCEKGIMNEYKFIKIPAFEHNLRFLRDSGYLEMTFKIGALMDNENIAKKVKLTPIGRYYIELRGNYKK